MEVIWHPCIHSLPKLESIKSVAHKIALSGILHERMWAEGYAHDEQVPFWMWYCGTGKNRQSDIRLGSTPSARMHAITADDLVLCAWHVKDHASVQKTPGEYRGKSCKTPQKKQWRIGNLLNACHSAGRACATCCGAYQN